MVLFLMCLLSLTRETPLLYNASVKNVFFGYGDRDAVNNALQAISIIAYFIWASTEVISN